MNAVQEGGRTVAAPPPLVDNRTQTFGGDSPSQGCRRSAVSVANPRAPGGQNRDVNA